MRMATFSLPSLLINGTAWIRTMRFCQKRTSSKRKWRSWHWHWHAAAAVPRASRLAACALLVATTSLPAVRLLGSLCRTPMPARPCPAGTAAAAVLLLACSARAQLGGDTLPLPSGQDGACNLATLGSRLDAWSNACCLVTTGAGGVCDATSLLQCSVDCALQTLPLLTDCRALLDPVLDGNDGHQDGSAYLLDVAYQACAAIPTSVALERVESLIAAGSCSLEDGNGWGETAVVATCEDVNSNCASALSMGFPCANLGGQCDMTCTFCGADGSGHRRRGQDGTNNNCDLSTLDADYAQVNTICCDDSGGVCATGVPTVSTSPACRLPLPRRGAPWSALDAGCVAL